MDEGLATYFAYRLMAQKHGKNDALAKYPLGLPWLPNVRRYYFQVLRVRDFQRELEEFTGHEWEDFCQRWLYGKGMTDWCVEKVTVEKQGGPCRVTVLLRQKADYDEPTVLGFCLDGGDGYQ